MVSSKPRATAGSKTKILRIDRIRLDGDTQSRVELSDDVIHEYAELLKAGHKFPPLLVTFDGKDYWLYDGFHRRWAAIKAKVKRFTCHVVKGTREDARWLSYGTNIAHGLPRTNEDKQKAVTSALKHPKGAKLADNQIADHVGVSMPTVSKYRKQLVATSKILKSDERTGRDGRTINVANIGRKPVSRDSIPPPNTQPKTEPVSLPLIADEKPEPPPIVNGSPKKPERAVFVKLRTLFDEMSKAERVTAMTMWSDWLEE